MKKIITLLLICILVGGCSVRKTEELTNSQKFDNEYAVGENNPFTYISLDELEKLFKTGNGLLFMGNSDCEWCIESVNILNKLLNKKDIEEIFYFNPGSLSQKDKDYVLYLINEEIENIEISTIKLPGLYVIIDGVIIDYDDTSLESVNEDEMDSHKKQEKNYSRLIDKYMKSI